MDIKEVLGKVNGVIGKLPFVKLAGNIPEGIRGKIPFLNVLIPFANHIASGAAIVVLVACFGGGGGGATSPNDFSYELITDIDKDGYAEDVDISLSDGIKITGYNGNGGKVVIPATIEGYPVRLIAFHRVQVDRPLNGASFNIPTYRITELVIPENVEVIAGLAFNLCENLKTLTLPASLKYIANFAFAYCVELENITIPASASFKCTSMSFHNCNKLPLKTRALLEELQK